eukprot:UN26185
MISTRMFLGIVVLVISVVNAKKTPCTLAETTFTIDETIDGNSGAMSYFAVVNVPGPSYVFRQNPGTCSYKELHFGVNQITKKVYVGMCGVGTSETVAALPDGVNAIAMKYHAYGELEIWANGAKLDLGISQINGRAFSSSSVFQSSCSDQIKVYNRALSQNELETMTALTSDDWECEENKMIGMHSCGVSINGDYFGTDGFADLRHDPSASETHANFDGPSVYSFNSKEKCIAQCEQVAECAYMNYNPSLARWGHSDQVGYCYMVGVNSPINDACVTMQPVDLHGYTMCKKPNTIGTTQTPTMQPSSIPTLNPTSSPSVNPSSNPSLNPSSSPTSKPTTNPSKRPTAEDFIVKVKAFHGEPKDVLDASKLQDQPDVDAEFFGFEHKLTPFTRRLLNRFYDVGEQGFGREEQEFA